MAYYATIITTLAVFAFGAIAAAVGLGVALALRGPRARLARTFAGRAGHPLGWAWGVALIATAGSLYLSEIVHLVPCSLCWYQRIAMYPLVLVLGVGMVRSEGVAWRYALPLPAVGLLIASYHVLIQWRPSLDVGACATGVPCSGRYVAVFGFVSIPTLAGAAFLLIIALLLLVRTAERAD